MKGAASVSETRTDDREPVDVGASARSLGELTSEVTGNLTQLVNLQLELARTELAADVRRVALGSGLFVVAALIAHLILILASITVGLGLIALGLAPWLAFLVVTVAYLLLAVVLGLVGLRFYKKVQRMPRTKETLARTRSVLRRERAAEA